MRPVLTMVALGLTIAVCASTSASAASARRSHARPHLAIDRGQSATAPDARSSGGARVAVPGWSDQDTRRWMDNASALWQGA